MGWVCVCARATQNAVKLNSFCTQFQSEWVKSCSTWTCVGCCCIFRTPNNQKHTSIENFVSNGKCIQPLTVARRQGNTCEYAVRPCSSSRLKLCGGHCTSTAIKCNQRDHKQHNASPTQTLWNFAMVELLCYNNSITYPLSSGPFKWWCWWWCFSSFLDLLSLSQFSQHICVEQLNIETKQFRTHN